MNRHILVAVDETDGSKRSAEFVDDFFAGTDTEITVVYGTSSPAEGVPYAGMSGWPGASRSEPTTDHETIRRAEALGEAVASSNAPSGAEVEAVFGETVDAILHEADDEDADMIVMGTNHPGFLQRLLGRSISAALTRTSARPVLVVP